LKNKIKGYIENYLSGKSSDKEYCLFNVPLPDREETIMFHYGVVQTMWYNEIAKHERIIRIRYPYILEILNIQDIS